MWAPPNTIRQLAVLIFYLGSVLQSSLLKTCLLFTSPFISLRAEDMWGEDPLSHLHLSTAFPQTGIRSRVVTSVIGSILSCTPAPTGLQLGCCNIFFVTRERGCSFRQQLGATVQGRAQTVETQSRETGTSPQHPAQRFQLNAALLCRLMTHARLL